MTGRQSPAWPTRSDKGPARPGWAFSFAWLPLAEGLGLARRPPAQVAARGPRLALGARCWAIADDCPPWAILEGLAEGMGCHVQAAACWSPLADLLAHELWAISQIGAQTY